MNIDSEEVHLWWASLDQAPLDLTGAHYRLSAEEQERAERILIPQNRQRFVTGRALLRKILADYLDLEPEKIHYSYGPYNKPAVANAVNDTVLNFNVSHSDDLFVVAVALNREVGVDIERIRPLPEAGQIAARHFSPLENAELLKISPGETTVAFYRCWTRKEAFLKACGLGLGEFLDQFDVSLGSEEPARLINVNWNPQETYRWSLHDLPIVYGYAGALAVEGQDCRLSHYDARL